MHDVNAALKKRSRWMAQAMQTKHSFRFVRLFAFRACEPDPESASQNRNQALSLSSHEATRLSRLPNRLLLPDLKRHRRSSMAVWTPGIRLRLPWMRFPDLPVPRPLPCLRNLHRDPTPSLSTRTRLLIRHGPRCSLSTTKTPRTTRRMTRGSLTTSIKPRRPLDLCRCRCTCPK